MVLVIISWLDNDVTQPRTPLVFPLEEKRPWSDAGHAIMLKSSRFLINYLGFLTTIIHRVNYKLNCKNYPNIKYLLTSSWIAN